MRKLLPFLALGAASLSALAACSAILGDFDVSTGDTADSGADTSVNEASPPPDHVAPNEAGMCPTPGEVPCNNLCTNTQNDPQNCGGCNMPCGQGQMCNAGKCTNGVVSMVAGTFHTCARVASGAVYCWGDNASGQLGDGTTMQRPTATLVPKDEQNNAVVALDIAAGALHTCALYPDGRVFCWGDGGYGQLGDGQRGFDGGTVTKPVPGAVRAFFSTTLPAFRGLSHGEGANHGCAAAGGDAGVWCWGENARGATGQDPMNSQASCGLNQTACDPWLKQANLLAVDTVGAGSAFTCAVVGGVVQCWGADGSGQLGDGKHLNFTSFPNPQPTNHLGAAMSATTTQIATGTSHACAAVSDGTVWCWGFNGSAQLGHPSGTAADAGDVNCSFDPGFPSPCAAPMEVMGVTNAIGVAAGGAHSCALKRDGTVWCWGANANGQLGGNASAAGSASPVQAQLPNTATDPAVGVAAGSNHTCAWTKSGKAYCWGFNNKGQLGNGTTDAGTINSGVPVAVQGLP